MSSSSLLRAFARFCRTVAGVSAIALVSWVAAPAAVADPIFEVAKPIPLYSYYAVGDVKAVVTAPASRPAPSFVLMGGGPDVDAAFRWLVQRAGITRGKWWAVRRDSGEWLRRVQPVHLLQR